MSKLNIKINGMDYSERGIAVSGHAVAADEHSVVIIGGFVDHTFVDKGVEDVMVNASAPQKIGINSAHVLIFLRQHKGLAGSLLYGRSYPQRTAIVTQEIFQRLWIIHSIKPPHKVNGISACLLILVIPQVPPDGNLCTAVLPFVLRTRPFQGMPLPAQQIRKVGQPCALLLILCKMNIFSCHYAALLFVLPFHTYLQPDPQRLFLLLNLTAKFPLNDRSALTPALVLQTVLNHPADMVQETQGRHSY